MKAITSTLLFTAAAVACLSTAQAALTSSKSEIQLSQATSADVQKNVAYVSAMGRGFIAGYKQGMYKETNY